jgi:hypothetical protein
VTGELTNEERAAILIEFALHARAVREEVDKVAEAYAGDDVLLRTQLRLVEEWVW